LVVAVAAVAVAAGAALLAVAARVCTYTPPDTMGQKHTSKKYDVESSLRDFDGKDESCGSSRSIGGELAA